MSDRFRGLWSRREPALVIIVDGSGHVADSVTLPLPVTSPAPRILAGSDWLTYPGTEWEQDPPGEWSIPVFKVQRPPAPHVNGTNTAAADSVAIADWDAKYLSELAAGLCAKGLECELVTAGAGAPYLHIKVSGAQSAAAKDLQDLVFASVEPDGQWRFWWPWIEPIAPAGEMTQAVEHILELYQDGREGANRREP